MAQLESIHNLKSSLNEEIEKLTNNLSDSIDLLNDISYDLEFISKMSTLLAEESKSASYKYALIRGVINISFEYTNFIETCNQEETDNEWVCIPMGLMIAKWIDYYYLTFEYEKGFKPISTNGKQNTNTTYSAFEELFITYNGHQNGISGLTQIKRDLFNVLLPNDKKNILKELSASLRVKIKQPIKHYGTNSKPFEYNDRVKSKSLNSNDSVIACLINGYGSIKVDKKFYSCLVKYGRLLLGQDSLLQGWAEYNSKQKHSKTYELKPLSYHLELLTREPETESNTLKAKNYLNKIKVDMYKDFVCLWSKGNKKLDTNYEVDHVIPFSVTSNNDLWNLLPCAPNVNKKKSNMIPLSQLNQKEVKLRIIKYWKAYCNFKESKSEFVSSVKNAFQVEIEDRDDIDTKLESVYEKLTNWCVFLVDVGNHKQWNNNNK